MTKHDQERKDALLKYIAKVELQITKDYGQTCKLIGKIQELRTAIESNEDFAWEKHPEVRNKVRALLDRFANKTSRRLTAAVSTAYDIGLTDANDAVLEQLPASLSQSKQKSAEEIAAESLASHRKGGKEAHAYATAMRGGLTLSDRVWNLTQNSEKEIEICVQNTLLAGGNADDLSREIRGYLNNPKALFRRVRNKKTGLLELSKAAKQYHPGRGVYRSAYMNAMRLTRTEINMAYRTAETASYADNPLVTGYRIRLSENHTTLFKGKRIPLVDICDRLAGEYPATFKWNGWHPQCRCIVVPGVLKEEDLDRLIEARGKAIRKGEDPSKVLPGLGRSNTMPEGFTEWYNENEDRISLAKYRPIWLNSATQLIEVAPTPKPKRTAEQEKLIKDAWKAHNEEVAAIKTAANNTLQEAQMLNSKDIDLTALKEAQNMPNLYVLRDAAHDIDVLITEVKNKQAMLEDIIPNADKWNKQHTLAELQATHDAVKAKLEQLEGLPLDQQKKQLEKEIKYVCDPSYLKPHNIYSTWQVSQAVYTKQLAAVEYKIAVKTIENQLEIIKQFSAQHPKATTLIKAIADVDTGLANNDSIVDLQNKLNVANGRYLKLLKTSTKATTSTSGAIDFDVMDDATIKNLLSKFNSNTVSEVDKVLRDQTETIWATLSQEERTVLTKYTQTYCYLNEPLRGLVYSGSMPKADFNNDMPLLTNAINKFKAPHDMVVRRGTDNYQINELGKMLSQVKPGDIFTEGGFLSTGAHREKGFHRSYNLVIVTPKGARGCFAEPFSHYTDSCKFNYDDSYGEMWNGVSKESIGGEFEWIGQRGTRFKVLSVLGNTITMQIIGQLK